MKKALITGITGQDGSYLAELLLEKGYCVHGLVRRSSTSNLNRIQHLLDPIREITLHEGDLSDSSSLERLVDSLQPDEIYNLAAMSHVRVSFDVPEYTASIDGVGVLRLLEAVRKNSPHTRFYQASTSELYGKVQQIPQSEITPFYPRSPYGVAKLYAYWVVINYREAYNLYACNGILFNHESPRRGETFVSKKITLAVAKITAGLQDKIVLGNLDAKRDWGYAKDFVEGMWLMLQQAKSEDFVLATGETTTVREFVQFAFNEVGIEIEWSGRGVDERGYDKSSGRVVVEVSPEFFRPSEVDILIGDPSKAKRKLGWSSKTSLKELVQVMMKHDLEFIEAFRGNSLMEDAKTALVYDWLVTVGGGEKTLEAIYECFPAPIYTLVHHDKKMAKTAFANAEIYSSFLQKIPFSTFCYRYLLPFFPLAIEQFNLSNYELILSTSHAVAKGVLTHSKQLHLCYCLTPMRYSWDLTHRYLQDLGSFQKTLARLTLHRLRNWDIASLNRVDYFAAISNYIAKRIKKVYGRDSEVIYPPVDVEAIPFQENKEDFYLTVSRLVPYKKIDLIIEAFSQTPERRLIVIGDGPEMAKIKQKAGKNIEILGYQNDLIVHDYMKKAKAFIFAAEEDFGIVVVEAQAAGTPVIAFGQGAVLETVIDQKTGLFFDAQTIPSLLKALEKFDRIEFDPKSLRENAWRFNKARFQAEFQDFVTRKLREFNENYHSCWW